MGGKKIKNVGTPVTQGICTPDGDFEDALAVDVPAPKPPLSSYDASKTPDLALQEVTTGGGRDFMTGGNGRHNAEAKLIVMQVIKRLREVNIAIGDLGALERKVEQEIVHYKQNALGQTNGNADKASFAEIIDNVFGFFTGRSKAPARAPENTESVHAVIETWIDAELARPEYEPIWEEGGFAAMEELRSRLRTSLRAELAAELQGTWGVDKLEDVPADFRGDAIAPLEGRAAEIFARTAESVVEMGAQDAVAQECTALNDDRTLEFLKSDHIRLTVYDDGTVTMEDKALGTEPKPMKEGDFFLQDYKIFAFATDGGPHLEVRRLNDPDAVPEIIPLRTSAPKADEPSIDGEFFGTLLEEQHPSVKEDLLERYPELETDPDALKRSIEYVERGLKTMRNDDEGYDILLKTSQVYLSARPNRAEIVLPTGRPSRTQGRIVEVYKGAEAPLKEDFEERLETFVK